MVPLLRGPTGILASCVLILSGCRTLDPAGVESFSSGISATKAQSELAFSAIAKVTREDSIDFAANQPTLKADNLVTVPSTGAVEAWDDLFSILEKYGQHLSALTSANSAKDVENSLGMLAKQFNATSATFKQVNFIATSPQISAKLAASFDEVARLLVQTRAQAVARKIAADTDLPMMAVFHGLADGIGATRKEGLRRFVAAHWAERRGVKQVAFLEAKTDLGRRRITQEFSELLDKEETQDHVLDSLRRSLLALASAHHAIAQGHTMGLRDAIDTISIELKHARDLRDQLKAKL